MENHILIPHLYKNISSKMHSLTIRNEKTENKNADIIFLDNDIGININTITQKINEERQRRSSIGINTSDHYEYKRKPKRKTRQNIISFKPKIYNAKPYSGLFKKYIISYEQMNKIKKNPEPEKEVKIPKLKLKKNFKTISDFSTKIIKRKEKKKIFPIKNRQKESLFTYNFIKDAYSEKQRLLLTISNNNLDSLDKNKIQNRLRKPKVNKKFKTMIYSNEDFKSMSTKTNKIKKFKLFNKTNLFQENRIDHFQINHSINKDIKTSFCNSLLKDIFAGENSKKSKEEIKLYKKDEILKLMEYPDSVFNYILQKLNEYNSYQNKRNGFKIKLENMKSDLKLTEQKALYQLINLKYDRVPGDEINIKTNLFCTKNKNNYLFI